MENRFYIGLDCGTNSVGICATDENYNLLRAKGQDMWASCSFGSNSNENLSIARRMNRSARRRTQRNKNRQKELRKIFEPIINEIDSNFFKRRDESKFLPEDKDFNNILFEDEMYNDKTFHNTFPTINHLKLSLLNSKMPYICDVRYIFIVASHYLKNRGHFLWNIGTSTEKESDCYNVINDFLEEELFTTEIQLKVKDCLKLKGQKNKKDALFNLFDKNKKKDIKLNFIISGLIGSKIDIKKVLEESVDEVQSFAIDKLEEKLPEISPVLSTEIIEVLSAIKSIYDITKLESILGGHTYFSEVQVERYEKHKKDLNILKEYIKDNLPEKYNEIFRNEKVKNNYVAYTKHNNYKKVTDSCNKEDFYSYIKSLIKNLEDCENKKYILEEIDNNTFLPKLRTTDNGVIPNQIHFKELEIILENASKYLPFLNEIDEKYNISNKDKILALMCFRIPYYVGPLNPHSQFAWLERVDGEITPWNFNKIVNLEKTAENFISQMVRKCSYLPSKMVVPKQSILYSRYMILNELNNIRINGKKLSIEDKHTIITSLYMTKRKVSLKDIKSYFLQQYSEKVEITGVEKLNANYSTYIDFKLIFKDKRISLEKIDEIVKIITLFGEEKKLVRNRVKEILPEIIEEELNQIVRLNYRDWANFSKEFLLDIKAPIEKGGEPLNIIDAMTFTDNNLMQLLSHNYNFLQEIENYNAINNKPISEFTYMNLVDKLPVSGNIKSSVWHALKMFKEYIEILIKKGISEEQISVFIESPRENSTQNKGKRTKSRKEQLVSLYNDCKKELDNYEKQILDFIKDKEERDFLNEKLFLYCLQFGKCAYSGEQINLTELLSSNTKYDVDHIYPRSKVKDDSLDNKVLVLKEYNARKSNEMLSSSVQQKMRPFWQILKNKGFMSEKKFERLTRVGDFTEEELCGFIARQLVETSNVSKILKDLIKLIFPKIEVVLVKAGNVSDFRKGVKVFPNQDTKDLIKFPKVRNLNNMHHAKDAYLNIVVGNVFYTKFTSNVANFLKDTKHNYYNLGRMYEKDIERNSRIAWKSGLEGTIKTVSDIMDKNTVICTKSTREDDSQLFKVNPVKKTNAKIPLKMGKNADVRLLDTDKYGGYDGIEKAYFSLIECEKNNKKERLIVSVPVYIAKMINNNDFSLLDYLSQIYSNVKILVPKIKKNTLIKLDNIPPMYIVGGTGETIEYKNNISLILPKELETYISKLNSFANSNYKYNILGITEENNLLLYQTLLDKINNGIYSKIPGFKGLTDTLEKNKETFEKYNILEQTKILLAILTTFQTSGTAKEVFHKSAIRIRLSYNVSKNNIEIINCSTTGLYKSVKRFETLK